jgi:hypothetical protein
VSRLVHIIWSFGEAKVDRDVETAANQVKEGRRMIAMEKKGRPLLQELC